MKNKNSGVIADLKFNLCLYLLAYELVLIYYALMQALAHRLPGTTIGLLSTAVLGWVIVFQLIKNGNALSNLKAEVGKGIGAHNLLFLVILSLNCFFYLFTIVIKNIVYLEDPIFIFDFWLYIRLVFLFFVPFVFWHYKVFIILASRFVASLSIILDSLADE